MKGLQNCTIKEVKPLYKNGEKAISIELAFLEEVGNQIVVGRGIYTPGEVVTFIEPDYCIPDTEFFKDYYYPNGDKSRCKLGSNGRVKAIKFNLNVDPEDNTPTYSYGIIIPKVDNHETLGITKYEEPEPKQPNSMSQSSNLKEFPSWIKKTDEENINNLKGVINRIIAEDGKIVLNGTIKVDGSSITLYCYKNDLGNLCSGICSRNKEIPLTVTKVVGQRTPNLWDKIVTFFSKEVDYNIYEEVLNDNVYIKIGLPYLEQAKRYFVNTVIPQGHNSIVYQGELIGKGLRGSGNKNNPSTKLEPQIKFFNCFVDGKYEPYGYYPSEFNKVNYAFVNEELTSFESIVETCNRFFSLHHRSTEELIEGIVLRTPDGKFSCKCMNMEYDLKK